METASHHILVVFGHPGVVARCSVFRFNLIHSTRRDLNDNRRGDCGLPVKPRTK